MASAFWLLVRLRFTRWNNLKRQGFWGAASASSAGSRRPRATAGAWALVWSTLAVVGLCVMSFGRFDSLAREHGAEGFQGRVVLLSSVSVCCLWMTALWGNRSWNAQGDDDVEWLSTLPAPAWVLHAAKIAEGAVLAPFGWLMLFPFFTGLSLHAGLGMLAPLVALGVCLPIFLSCSLLTSLIEVAKLALVRSRTFRALRVVGPLVGALTFLLWVCAPAFERLRGDAFGRWLDFAAAISWLPSSEPARALLSLPQAPLAALAWFSLYGVEMGVLLGLGMLALRKLYRVELVLERGVRGAIRTPASVQGPSTQRLAFGGLLGALVAKELRWLRRNPSRCMGIVVNVALVNALALLLMPRVTLGDTTTTPGVALFGAGVLLLWGQSALLELERPALWQWAALPRSTSSVFGRKTLFIAAFSILGTLPAAALASRALPRFAAAVPGLLYGATCLVVIAFFQTALWLRGVRPDAATSTFGHLVRLLQISLPAGVLASGFALFSTPGELVLRLGLVAAFAFTFWSASLDRMPYLLDPSAIRPNALTATYALITWLAMRNVQVALQGAWLQSGMPPARAAAFAFFVAGGGTVLASLLWLKYRRGLAGLAERLGLVEGKGVRVILHEGLLWAAPALAINQLYVALLRPELVESGAGVSQQPVLATLLADSVLSVVGVGCIAAPLFEEIVFRGMLYRSLRSNWSIRLSLLSSAVVFTSDHPLADAIPVFCAGVCITLAFERSRSLYAAMLTHALYNGGIAAIWFVSRS